MHGNGDYSKDLPFFVTGHNFPEPYRQSLKFLKDNNMNVFMENEFINKYY